MFWRCIVQCHSGHVVRNTGVSSIRQSKKLEARVKIKQSEILLVFDGFFFGDSVFSHTLRRHDMTEIGPNLADPGQTLTAIGQMGPNSGQTRSSSGQRWLSSSQFWRKMGKFERKLRKNDGQIVGWHPLCDARPRGVAIIGRRALLHTPRITVQYRRGKPGLRNQAALPLCSHAGASSAKHRVPGMKEAVRHETSTHCTMGCGGPWRVPSAAPHLRFPGCGYVAL